MYHDLDLIRGQIEEPLCLNEFQSLIHQRCRVNGDLVAHAPVRVIQCICNSDIFQFRTSLSEERPAGCSQNDLVQLFPAISLQALEDGGVFAVHGIDMHTLPGSLFHDQ